ncbi:MAG: cytochrome c oxidase subunit II [Pseudomonadota bacterium]
MTPFLRSLFCLSGLTASAAPALAGVPTPGALGFQQPVTRIAERLHWFHDGLLLPIITVVTIFVLALLCWVIFRYNRKANTEARKFSHNTVVEVVWTVVPVLILIVIALPSFTNLFYIEQEPDLELIAQSGDLDNPNIFPGAAAEGWITVKAQGNQWNWTYQYPDIDDGGFPLEFVSNPLHTGLSTDPASTEADPYALATDYPMVIPVNRYVRYQTTASDVIHSWTVPSFGVKTDAVPGKLNQGWFLVEEPGVYYGQCSELCGVNHAFMPIEVRVVSQEQYDQWVETMLTGDFDAAAQLVATIEPMDEHTQLASAD